MHAAVCLPEPAEMRTSRQCHSLGCHANSIGLRTEACCLRGPACLRGLAVCEDMQPARPPLQTLSVDLLMSTIDDGYLRERCADSVRARPTIPNTMHGGPAAAPRL